MVAMVWDEVAILVWDEAVISLEYNVLAEQLN